MLRPSCTMVQMNWMTQSAETIMSVGLRFIRRTTNAPMGAPSATIGAAASHA